MLDPYVLLGVKRGESLPEIKRKYKILLQKYHPDHYPDKDEALYKTNLIIKAYKSILREVEIISLLKKTTKNLYRIDGDLIEFYLKEEYNSFFTLFEPENQIYQFTIESNLIKKIPYSIQIHFFQRTEELSATFRTLVLSKPLVIGKSKKIVLKEKGDYYSKGFKNLVIFVKVV